MAAAALVCAGIFAAPAIVDRMSDFPTQMYQLSAACIALVLGALLGHYADRRHQAHRTLAQAETGYRALLERVPAIVYTAEYGTEGRWSYVSPKIEPILGYSVEEWLRGRRRGMRPCTRTIATRRSPPRIAAARPGSRSTPSTGCSRATGASCGFATRHRRAGRARRSRADAGRDAGHHVAQARGGGARAALCGTAAARRGGLGERRSARGVLRDRGGSLRLGARRLLGGRRARRHAALRGHVARGRHRDRAVRGREQRAALRPRRGPSRPRMGQQRPRVDRGLGARAELSHAPAPRARAGCGPASRVPAWAGDRSVACSSSSRASCGRRTPRW